MVKNFLWALLAIFILACSNPSEDSTSGESRMDDTPGRDIAYYDIDSLDSYLTGHPNHVPTLALRSRAHLQGANYPYARADASAILELDSSNHDGWLLFGEASYLRNESRTARDAWQRCISEHPDETECRLKLAELYSMVMEYEKSFDLVDKVIEIDNTNATAYYIKGLNIRDSKGDTAMALSYIQKAIDLDYSYVSAIEMAGVLTAAKGDPVALGYYDRLLELVPNNPSTYYNIGMFHLGVKNYNEAIEAFLKCTQLNPSDAEAFFNLGYIYLELNILSEARGYFSQSINAREINFRAYYGRAYCWELGGDLMNAEKDYRQALALNPQHQPSQEGLNRVLSLK